MQRVLAANPEWASVLRRHPSGMPLTVAHGASAGDVNALARHWVSAHEPGRLTPVPGVPCCHTSEGYTVVDLSAAATAAERAACAAYVRELGRSKHATRGAHLVLVYDMHLAGPRAFLDPGHVRLVGTTCRLHTLPGALLSGANLLRVRCPEAPVAPALAALAKRAMCSGACVQAARRYAHEAAKACLDPAAPYRALLGLSRPADAGPLSERAARMEHAALGITRPVHALELFALWAQSALDARDPGGDEA